MTLQPIEDFRMEFEQIVFQELGKKIWNIKPDDQLRLMRLKVWSVRYKVPVAYILQKLVPHYAKLANNFRRRFSGDGLGITIAVLTGPAAEEKLKEFIGRDYPDGENITAWRDSEKSRIIRKVSKNKIIGQPTPVLRFPTIKRYIASYEARIKEEKKQEAKLERMLAKQPYRDNPFR